MHAYVSVLNLGYMQEEGPQTTQHPPKVTHRPEETWGNMAKQKEGTDKLSTANIVPKTITQMYLTQPESMQQQLYVLDREILPSIYYPHNTN